MKSRVFSVVGVIAVLACSPSAAHADPSGDATADKREYAAADPPDLPQGLQRKVRRLRAAGWSFIGSAVVVFGSIFVV